MRLRKYLLVLASMVALVHPVEAKTLTYPDLVKRLTDLDRLATLPPPGEKTAQNFSASSGMTRFKLCWRRPRRTGGIP
jgi:hypothetical protein